MISALVIITFLMIDFAAFALKDADSYPLVAHTRINTYIENVYLIFICRVSSGGKNTDLHNFLLFKAVSNICRSNTSSKICSALTAQLR